MLSGLLVVPASQPFQVLLMPTPELSHQDSPATGTKFITTCQSWARPSRVPPTHWLTSYRGGRIKELHSLRDFFLKDGDLQPVNSDWAMMRLFMDDINWGDLGINKQSSSPNSNINDVFYLCQRIKIFKYDVSFLSVHQLLKCSLIYIYHLHVQMNGVCISSVTSLLKLKR